MLRRDGLAELGERHAGSDAGALIYNPLPYPVRRAIRVPAHPRVDILVRPAVHFRQRQDVEASDVTDDETRMVSVDLPPLGYAVLPLAQLAAPAGDLTVSNGRLRNDSVEVRLDTDRGGLLALVIDGANRIDAAWDFGFGVPVLESPEPALRATIFVPPAFTDFESAFDLHRQWQTDWTARREAGRLTATKVQRQSGEAAVTQSFAFTTGELAHVTYRLSPGDDALRIEVAVDKVRRASPHAMYLPLPFALDETGWKTHYESAGAFVELDREQLPGSNRHFVTTQRLLRLQDASRGVTIASPDLPLFQVGGFTFGRHRRGDVVREAPVVLAWLNNNYWDTNFEVTQSGPITCRLTLLAHAAEPVSHSVARALPYVVEPQVHLLRCGAAATEQLLDIDADGLVVTGMERDGATVRIWGLNPDDDGHHLQLGDAALKIVNAAHTALDGSEHHALERTDGRLRLEVAPRAWVGLELDVAL